MATKFSDGVKKLKVEMLKNHFSLNLTGIVEQSEGDGTKTVFVSSMGEDDLCITVDEKTGKANKAWMIYEGEEIDINNKVLAQSLYSSIVKTDNQQSKENQEARKMDLESMIKKYHTTKTVQYEDKDTDTIFVDFAGQENVSMSIKYNKKTHMPVSVWSLIDGDELEITDPKMVQSIYKNVEKKIALEQGLEVAKSARGL